MKWTFLLQLCTGAVLLGITQVVPVHSDFALDIIVDDYSTSLSRRDDGFCCRCTCLLGCLFGCCSNCNDELLQMVVYVYFDACQNGSCNLWGRYQVHLENDLQITIEGPGDPSECPANEPISIVIEVFHAVVDNDNHLGTIQTTTPHLTPFGDFFPASAVTMDGLTFTLQYRLRCAPPTGATVVANATSTETIASTLTETVTDTITNTVFETQVVTSSFSCPVFTPTVITTTVTLDLSLSITPCPEQLAATTITTTVDLSPSTVPCSEQLTATTITTTVDLSPSRVPCSEQLTATTITTTVDLSPSRVPCSEQLATTTITTTVDLYPSTIPCPEQQSGGKYNSVAIGAGVAVGLTASGVITTLAIVVVICFRGKKQQQLRSTPTAAGNNTTGVEWPLYERPIQKQPDTRRSLPSEDVPRYSGRMSSNLSYQTQKEDLPSVLDCGGNDDDKDTNAGSVDVKDDDYM